MANIKIRFVNFDRSEALETYTEEHMHNLVTRIDRRPGETKSIEVQFRLDNKAVFGTVKDSEVMISYKYPGLKNIFHVKKHGKDLRKALIEAIHAMETLIQKATEKSEGGRKKDMRTARKAKTASRARA